MRLAEKKMNRKSGLISFIMVTVLIYLAVNLLMAKELDGSSEILRDAVVEGIKANTAKLNCAVITWRSELSHFEALADRIGPKESYQLEKGTHQLWWKGEKIAANKRKDYLRYGENAKPSVVTDKVSMVYDGKVFHAKSPRPNDPKMSDVLLHKELRFKQGDNYLREIGWDNRAGSLIANVTLEGPAVEPGTQKFSIEEGVDGSKLVKHAFYNSRTGQVGFGYYDIDKNYSLVRYENYASETQLVGRKDYRYEQIAGGAWFPVEVTTTGFNMTTGEKVSCGKMVVDVNKSVFNDPTAIPEKVFEFKAGKYAEVSDYLHGERLLYSTDVSPLSTDTLNDMVDDFLVDDGMVNEVKDIEVISHNKRVDVKVSDDSHAHDGQVHDGHTHQQNSSDNNTPWLALSLVLVGVLVCVIGIVWIFRSR